MNGGMASNQRDSLLGRVLSAIGLRSDEIAAGHGTLPEAGPRPSTQSRRRSRQEQRERLPEAPEKEAEAITEAIDALDEQIRQSVNDPDEPKTSRDMVEEAKKRWSSDS